jgi:hypothetical protein
VQNLDKDSIVNALNAIQNGKDAGFYHDQLEVVIGVLMETSEETIAAVIKDIHEDTDDNTDLEN